MSARNSTVLPAPFGPTIASDVPASTENDRSRRTVVSPKRTVRWRTSRMVAGLIRRDKACQALGKKGKAFGTCECTRAMPVPGAHCLVPDLLRLLARLEHDAPLVRDVAVPDAHPGAVLRAARCCGVYFMLVQAAEAHSRTMSRPSIGITPSRWRRSEAASRATHASPPAATARSASSSGSPCAPAVPASGAGAARNSLAPVHTFGRVMPSSSQTRYVPSACRFHTLKYAPLRSISFES